MFQSHNTTNQILDPIPHAQIVPLLHTRRILLRRSIIVILPPLLAPPLDGIQYRILHRNLLLPRGIPGTGNPPPPIRRTVLGMMIRHGIAQRDLQHVRVDPRAVQSLGVAVRQPTHGRDGVLEVPSLASPRPAEGGQASLQCVGPLHELLGLLPPAQLGGGRTSLQQCQHRLTRAIVRQRQIQRRHPVVVLKVERVGIRLDQQTDDIGIRTIARGHVKGQRTVLIATRRALGMVQQQNLHGVGSGLPHCRLMQRQIPHAVGLARARWVRAGSVA
mmetsp:Transcript_31635/g.76582  ORF Transcript_31635/g.76582 Transcript_31635/m.76582 type:complete len:274 (+) Transcript_31635:1026-1847(+)